MIWMVSTFTLTSIYTSSHISNPLQHHIHSCYCCILYQNYQYLSLPTISIPYGTSSEILSTHFLDAQSIDEGVVLTEIEDAFLTAAAYNKQPEMLKCLEIDPNVVHVSVDGQTSSTHPVDIFSHENISMSYY